MNDDQELERTVACFVGAFEHVFGDDWARTKDCLGYPNTFIDPAGTFLNPMEFDEANNWSSRHMLLESYRKLVEAMLRRGIHPKLPDEGASNG